MPSGAREKPAKVLNKKHNHLAVGGMRNPAKSVRRLTQLAGRTKLAAMWDEFQEAHPKATDAAKNYGKSDNWFHEGPCRCGGRP